MILGLSGSYYRHSCTRPVIHTQEKSKASMKWDGVKGIAASETFRQGFHLNLPSINQSTMRSVAQVVMPLETLCKQLLVFAPSLELRAYAIGKDVSKQA